MSNGLNMRGRWNIVKYFGDERPTFIEGKGWVGNVAEQVSGSNVITNAGRDELFKLLFDMSGLPMVAGGVGDDATAPDETDTNLISEIIVGTARKDLTNVDGDPLSSADIAAGTLPYFREITVMFEFPSTDATDTTTFESFGLFTTATLPGTAGATSGVMFNRFLPPAPIEKETGATVLVRCTLEW